MFKYLQFLNPNPGFSLLKGTLKGIFLILCGRFVLENYNFAHIVKTPEYFSRYQYNHPMTPPIYRPYQWDEPELYEEYLEFIQKLENLTQYQVDTYQYKKVFNPALEDGFILKEAFFESETERVFDEIRSEVRRQHKTGTNKDLLNQYKQTEKNILLERFQAQIKPTG